MITRPLDLASKLRRPPKNFDALFLVNVGLIALFFGLFGSRFVLSPGLGLDFALPKSELALAGATPTDVVIAVIRTDMASADGSVLNYAQLRQWLARRAAGKTNLRLLIQGSASLTTQDLSLLRDMAADAGFSGFQLAVEPTAGGAQRAQP